MIDLHMHTTYSDGADDLIEVLGYYVDTKMINDYMKEYSKTNSKEKLQQKYFNILYERCKEMGLVMSNKENIEFDSKKDWASVKIYEEIKFHEQNRLKLPDRMYA